MRFFDKKEQGSGFSKQSPHHYAFAHVALRKICQQDPREFFGIMGSPKRDEFLKDVWRQVRKNCDPQGPPSFDIHDVDITTRLIQNFPSIVVTMPPPSAVAEAFFVGIILKIDLDSRNGPEHPEIAYFTLEKGMNLDGTDRTVLCSWSGKDIHQNLGAGPPATQEEFVKAIAQRV